MCPEPEEREAGLLVVNVDPRIAALRSSLSQLTCEEIGRILDCAADAMVYDGCNFEATTEKYCPLAVAFNVPKLMSDRYRETGVEATNEAVDKAIGEIGRSLRGRDFLYNQMHGIAGEGYRKDRAKDVRDACLYVLVSRVNGEDGGR
jgi:hypothetical protein